MVLLLVLVELLLLYRLSVVVHSLVFRFFKRIFRSTRISLWLYSMLFLPGTFIHELSHFIAAVLLFVHVGGMSLMPEYEEGRLKLGEVKVAKTDPIRNFVIGVAPLLFGTAVVLGLIYFASQNNIIYDLRFAVLFVYLIFTVSNTMYSSKVDMQESWKFFVIIAALIGTAFIFRVPVNFEFLNNQKFLEAFRQLAIYLAVPLAIDVLLLVVARRW